MRLLRSPSSPGRQGGRPPLLNDTPTSRKRRAVAAATAAAAQQATDSLGSSSICFSEQSSTEIRPAVTFEPGANHLFHDEELDNFVQYVDEDSEESSSGEVHQVSFDSQDFSEERGGVKGLLFGKRRKRKQQQRQSSATKQQQRRPFQEQQPLPKRNAAKTLSEQRPQALSQSALVVADASNFTRQFSSAEPQQPSSQSTMQFYQNNVDPLPSLTSNTLSRLGSLRSIELEIETVPDSPRMERLSPFTQDGAFLDAESAEGGSRLITRNPSWRSSSADASVRLSCQNDQEQYSTAMVPYPTRRIEVVDSCSSSTTSSALQRHDSWRGRLDRRDIYHRHYIPSRQELEELKELEEYLGVYSSKTRHRFSALWQQLVPPLDVAAKWENRRDLLQSQLSASSISSRSAIISNALQVQSPKQVSNNHAYYSIILKRGHIQFEQYQDYYCEWIVLTRGFVVARPNFQFIPRFQAGDLWTSVVQVQPTDPLSITMTCTSRASSDHLSLTQLKQQQQYGFYTYELSSETPQKQAAWLEALRRVVIQAHDMAATHEKEMGGLGWQYRVVYNPFYTEAVTGNPIQKDKILAGSTGHIDLNALDSYNSYAPLHYATRANHARVIRFLLEAGADVHVGDGYGRTPMYYAELHQLPETTIQLLESYGARRAKKLPPPEGPRPKDNSCQRKLIVVVMILLLLACGASGVLWKLGMLEQFGIGGNDGDAGDDTGYGVIYSSTAPSLSDGFSRAPLPALENRGRGTRSPYPTAIPTNNYIKTPPPTSASSVSSSTISGPSFQSEQPSIMLDTELLQLLEAESSDSGVALHKNGSPQHRAFQWLAKNANLEAYSSERKLQRYALATLYYGTNGDEWSENLWWLSDEDECTWYTKQSFAGYPVCSIGAFGDKSKILMNLDLSFNNLRGTLPPEIGLLSGLTRVDFDGGPSGFLTGPLPSEIGKLSLIESFSARANQLSGSLPQELGNWVQVRTIDLSFNNLLGEIPATFGSMTLVTELTLEMNELSGRLPAVAFGRLSNLFKLSLGANQFTGPVPSEIGLLTQLRYLYMESNQFSSLPTQIGRLENLNLFSIFQNIIQGSIPSELGRLKKLGTLLLRSNAFGSIIPSELGLMENLLDGLDLSYNQISGSIPSELGSVTRLRSLYLQDNAISGVIPSEISRLSHLNTLRIESNDIVGTVPVDLCNIFANTYPNFYADCKSEVTCPCCTYCCSDGQGCTCQFTGTPNAFLC